MQNIVHLQWELRSKTWFVPRSISVPTCHGPCSVTFFPKNNQRSAPMEPPMMATSPLSSATITTGHPRQTYIRAPSEYFLHSATTNTTCILIIVITNQHHVLPTAAQPQPLLSSEFRRRCWVQSCERRWLQLVGCAALLLDASNFGGPDGVGESGVEPRRSLRRRERVKEK